MGMPTMRWVAAALAGLALAACGTQQAASTSSATQPASPASTSPARASGALCSDVAAVTRLVVTRATALPQNHLHFAVPAGVTVSDPAAARDVARGRLRAAGHAAWHRHELPGRPGRQLPAELRGRPGTRSRW